MDYSPPGSFVHGISQARILDWVAISFPRGSSWPKDQTCVSCISYIGRQILYCWASRMGWRIKRTKVRRLVWWVGKNSCERTWRETGGQWSGNMRQRSHQRVRDIFRGLMHQDQLSDFSWGLGKSVKNGGMFRRGKMPSSFLDPSMIIWIYRIIVCVSLNPQFLTKCRCWMKLKCYLTNIISCEDVQ